jgi:hypothetical protein
MCFGNAHVSPPHPAFLRFVIYYLEDVSHGLFETTALQKIAANSLAEFKVQPMYVTIRGMQQPNGTGTKIRFPLLKRIWELLCHTSKGALQAAYRSVFYVSAISAEKCYKQTNSVAFSPRANSTD